MCVHCHLRWWWRMRKRGQSDLHIAALADGEDGRAARRADLVLLVLEAALEALEAVAVRAVLRPHGVLAHLCTRPLQHSGALHTELIVSHTDACLEVKGAGHGEERNTHLCRSDTRCSAPGSARPRRM